MDSMTLPVLRKPTASIQLSHPFTHCERKLLNTLLFYAQSHDTGTISEIRHRIPISDVYEAIGWHESENAFALKQRMEKLMSTVIRWNQYGEDKTRKWEICTFITYGLLVEVKHQRLYLLIFCASTCPWEAIPTSSLSICVGMC